MQKFSSVALDPAGNSLAGVTVTVYNQGTLVLASIYSDNGVTLKANPFATGVDGSYQFYAANGRYDVVLVKSGYTFNAAETSDMLLFDPTGTSGTQFGGHLFNLTLSNDGSDAVNDLDIAVGEAVSDDVVLADRVLISLVTALVKQIDAVWAAGTNAGMRDSTDTLVGAKWFNIYLFVRGAGGIDIFASTSLTPSLPDGGTKKRRIGAIYWAGATIKAFSQFGDDFTWAVSVLDVDTTNPGTAAVLATLTVPTGVVVDAKFNVQSNAGAATKNEVHVSSPASTDEAPSATVAPLTNILAFNSNSQISGLMQVRTNTASQIRYRAIASAADTIVRMATLGYIDNRGRLV